MQEIESNTTDRNKSNLFIYSTGLCLYKEFGVANYEKNFNKSVFPHRIVSLNMDLFKSESGIIYLENADYLHRVFDQIVRDFDMTGVPFNGEDNSPKSYTELYNLVLSNISDLINSDSMHFKNLLYRIDVSEKKIHQRMLLRNETQLDAVVSKMIIDRCLQKVLTREKYS